MGKPNQYTAQQFIEAIKSSGGIVTHIAQRVGCTWHTAKRYIDIHPTVARAWQDEREKLKDVGEVQLIKQVNAGEMWAVKYFLSTQAKDRGYTTRTEHTGADGGDISIALKHLAGMTDDELRAEHRRLEAALGSLDGTDDAAGSETAAEGPSPLDAEPGASDGSVLLEG